MLYDAVLLPDGYVPALSLDNPADTQRGMSRIAAEFDRVLRPGKTRHIHARAVMPENKTFVNRDLEITYRFPSDHPRAGEERHDWIDRGDRVLYGLLKADGPIRAAGPDDPKAVTPETVVPGDPTTAE